MCQNARHKKWFAVIVVFATSIAGVALYPQFETLVGLDEAFFDCSCAQAIEAKHRGGTIVDAIEQFRIDRGNYPSSLDDLLPVYLSHIPEPGYGDKNWMYAVNESEGFFELRFGIKDFYPCCYWNSKRKAWDADS